MQFGLHIRPRVDQRGGFTLLEVAVSAAMLTALLAFVGRAIFAVEAGVRRADEHAEAVRVVDNLLEEFLAAPWDEIDGNGISRLALPTYVQNRWPKARVIGSVQPLDDPVPSKRVAMTLEMGEGRGRSVTMTTWIYRAGEE